MTYEEALRAMQEILDNAGDVEIDHCHADDVLCDFLEALGYGDLIEIYYKIYKWYA